MGANGRPRTAAITRLLPRLIKPTGEDGCWVFQGAKDNGYGVIQLGLGLGTKQTHVVMWEHANGLRPTGHDVHHRCRNRACCNPEHLELVEHASHARHHAPAPKTHCRKGHALVPDNTYSSASPWGRPKITCRLCTLAAQAEARRLFRSANPRPVRTHCNSGRHEWIAENLMRDRAGNNKKACRLCFNEGQQRRRSRT